MKISNQHNATRDLTAARSFGIRVRMKSTDTFARVLGTDWQHEHWYTSARERNAALKDMASQHLYSRNGDLPTLIFEPIERDD